jgi:hypothetical protein
LAQYAPGSLQLDLLRHVLAIMTQQASAQALWSRPGTQTAIQDIVRSFVQQEPIYTVLALVHTGAGPDVTSIATQLLYGVWKSVATVPQAWMEGISALLPDDDPWLTVPLVLQTLLVRTRDVLRADPATIAAPNMDLAGITDCIAVMRSVLTTALSRFVAQYSGAAGAAMALPVPFSSNAVQPNSYAGLALEVLNLVPAASTAPHEQDVLQYVRCGVQLILRMGLEAPTLAVLQQMLHPAPPLQMLPLAVVRVLENVDDVRQLLTALVIASESPVQVSGSDVSVVVEQAGAPASTGSASTATTASSGLHDQARDVLAAFVAAVLDGAGPGIVPEAVKCAQLRTLITLVTTSPNAGATILATVQSMPSRLILLLASPIPHVKFLAASLLCPVLRLPPDVAVRLMELCPDAKQTPTATGPAFPGKSNSSPSGVASALAELADPALGTDISFFSAGHSNGIASAVTGMSLPAINEVIKALNYVAVELPALPATTAAPNADMQSVIEMASRRIETGPLSKLRAALRLDEAIGFNSKPAQAAAMPTGGKHSERVVTVPLNETAGAQFVHTPTTKANLTTVTEAMNGSPILLEGATGKPPTMHYVCHQFVHFYV